jgi:hypothetical protein
MANDNEYFLGCVLHAKTHLPCPVYKYGKREVRIYTPDDDEEGNGKYDKGEYGSEYTLSEASGFPRAHTPDGVKTKNAGYGTVLYTGLCLGAKLEDAGFLELQTQVAGAGISSNKRRSRAADAWWAAAKNNFDLVYEVDVEGEEENYDQTLTAGDHTGAVFRRINNALIQALAPQGSLDIHSVQVTGTLTTEGTADVYPYDRSHGCLGAESLVPFWCVSESNPEAHAWYEGPEVIKEFLSAADDIEIFDDVFGCMVLGQNLALASFIGVMASKLGKKKLFDEVMLMSLLGKKLEEAGETAWATDSLYEGLRPFRLNPSDPNVQQAMRSLTKPERIAIERRAERIRALGIDKLADFDE